VSVRAAPGAKLAARLGARVGEVAGRRTVPMLCGHDQTSARVLEQPGFLFEVKVDGVRIVCDKRGEDVALTYRSLRDATGTYPEIAAAISALGEPRVVLDGEIVAFDAEGRPDFQRLGRRIQARGREVARAARSVAVVYVVFDVLAVGDRDVRGLPLEARKRILAEVVPEATPAGAPLRLHPTFEDGPSLFRLCRENRLEGVVAKRRAAPYRSGEDGREPPRTGDWIKVKCELDVDLVVCGWTEGEGKRRRLGALDLAAYEGGRLVVRGSVGSGLDEDTIDELLERLQELEVPRPTAEGTFLPKRGRHHARPEIVVSVRTMGVTSDGLLRHPVFRGVRPDMAPEDCTLAPTPAPKADELEAITTERLALRIQGGGAAPREAVERGVSVVRERFRAIGLAAFVRPGRGTAFDVVVPLAPAPLAAAKALAELVARLCEEELGRSGVEARVLVPVKLARPWALTAEETAAGGGARGGDLTAAVSALERVLR
jgi:bifunctional non-homologous end joining protein LigD